MQFIESNRENYPIVNQMYDIIAGFRKQRKHITMCKVPACMRIRGNEAADKAAKI